MPSLPGRVQTSLQCHFVLFIEGRSSRRVSGRSPPPQTACDGWRHLVVVERLLWGDAGAQGAVCLAGGNACPLEGCGGIGGYADLLATLRRGRGREYRELLAWLGGPFDPTAFDLAVTNHALKRLR